jgi:hypothetical protein
MVSRVRKLAEDTGGTKRYRPDILGLSFETDRLQSLATLEAAGWDSTSTTSTFIVRPLARVIARLAWFPLGRLADFSYV